MIHVTCSNINGEYSKALIKTKNSQIDSLKAEVALLRKNMRYVFVIIWSRGDIDVGDGFWGKNVLVTI